MIKLSKRGDTTSSSSNDTEIEGVGIEKVNYLTYATGWVSKIIDRCICVKEEG